MASRALTARFRRPLMAWSALFKAELLALSRSWVLRGWIVALALTEFFVLTGMLAQSRSQMLPASAILAAHLNGFLLVWSLVIIVLGAGSVSTESDVIADSILSRSCTRTQFIAAKLAARALAVMLVFLVSSLIAGVCAFRYAANDMTVSTLATGMAIEGLAVLLLLSIGIALSVIANNTIFAIVGALLLWYVAAPIFSFIGAEYLSPTSLTRNLPRILKDPALLQLAHVTATQTSLTLQFSKPLDARTAEEPANYIVQTSAGQQLFATTAVYDTGRTSVLLQGLDLPAGDTVKVTARNVADTGGAEIGPAANAFSATVPGAVTERGHANAPSGNAARENDAARVSAPMIGVGRQIAVRSGGGPAPSRDTSDRIAPRVQRCDATPRSLSVYFTKEMDVKDAETVANFVIENPQGKRLTARSATYSEETRSVLLSGLELALADPVIVTAMNVRDRNGNPIARRDSTATYSGVTTWKYVLGFGAPTLAAFLIAIVWFSKRDL